MTVLAVFIGRFVTLKIANKKAERLFEESLLCYHPFDSGLGVSLVSLMRFAEPEGLRQLNELYSTLAFSSLTLGLLWRISRCKISRFAAALSIFSSQPYCWAEVIEVHDDAPGRQHVTAH